MSRSAAAAEMAIAERAKSRSEIQPSIFNPRSTFQPSSCTRRERSASVIRGMNARRSNGHDIARARKAQGDATRLCVEASRDLSYGMCHIVLPKLTPYRHTYLRVTATTVVTVWSTTLIHQPYMVQAIALYTVYSRANSNKSEICRDYMHVIRIEVSTSTRIPISESEFCGPYRIDQRAKFDSCMYILYIYGRTGYSAFRSAITD